MTQLDLVVRGGRLTTEPRSAVVDIGIHDGRIVQLGGDMQAARELDARGKLLLPGGVDDFLSGSAAALPGGLTSVGNMTSPATPDEAIFDTLQRDVDALQQQGIADVFLHPVVINPSESLLADIPRLLDRGYSSLKFFMPFPGFDAQVGAYLEVVRRAGEDHALVTGAACWCSSRRGRCTCN